jgi:hypothetical protein
MVWMRFGPKKELNRTCIDSVGSGSGAAILATDAFGLPLMTRWKERERVLYPLVRDDSIGSGMALSRTLVQC